MKIRALLVAINNYRQVPNLKGCVSDIKKVATYLQQSGASCEIECLLDNKATKSAIVEAFGTVTQNIKSEDSFLFYYAGHGTQEEADDIWDETDNLLECIVCFDEHPANPSGYLLCDKELRFLIYELSKTGCHILTIFDCCHSGDNTRNAYPMLAGFKDHDLRERRLHKAFEKRRWEDFIFHHNIDRNGINGRDVNEFLPQGKHVQIAACESDESAFEVKGEGVFTKTLLKVLADSGGNICYLDLKSRVRQYLRFVYEQQPRIYTVGATEAETQQMLYTRFLNNQYADEQRFIAEAVYNKEKGWMINLGVIHGINKNTIIYVFDPLSPEKFYRAAALEIFPDYSFLLFPHANIIDASSYTALKVVIEGIELYNLKITVLKHEGDPVTLKIIADKLIDSAAGHYVLTEDEASADYSLHMTSRFVYITYPGDRFRPIVLPLEFIETNAGDSLQDLNIERFIEFLKHISKWNYIKMLQNKKANDWNVDPIIVTIFQIRDDGTETILPVHKDGHDSFVDVQAADKSSLRIRLENNTGRKIFVGAVYLSYNFQAYVHLLERKVAVLHPQEYVSLGVRSSNRTRSDLIPLQLPDVIQEYNWQGYTETIKIIVSNEEFNIEALSLPSLPSPLTLNTQLDAERSSRSPVFEIKESMPGFDEWTTQTVHLNYPNVYYNNVPISKINQMIEWDKTAIFAKGLYGSH